MQANSQKFQGFAITGNELVTLSLNNVNIPIEENIKLLGVYIDNKLVFDLHISKLCKKAGFHIIAIRRLAKYLNREELLRLFHAFIRSNFQYACIVWHFTSNSNTLKMEKIQRRALRIVMNNYTCSYNDLLLEAKIPSLHVSRIKTIAIETFKCINKLNPGFLHDLFTINETGYDLRDGQKIQPPKVKTTSFGLNSFRFEAARIWNLIPSEIKLTDSLPAFINGITKWQGPQCACGNCVLCKIGLL